MLRGARGAEVALVLGATAPGALVQGTLVPGATVLGAAVSGAAVLGRGSLADCGQCRFVPADCQCVPSHPADLL